MRIRIYLIIYLSFLFLQVYSEPLHVEQTNYIIIDSIEVTGNKKTRENIILRELDITLGDTISTQGLANRLLRNRNRIFNTGLFLEVEIYFRGREATHKNLIVEVKERWYIYPIPIIEMADRNFNEWWQQRDRDLRRLNYGIDFKKKNMRGRNETLRLKLQGGFDQKAEIFYMVPYIDRKQRTGLNFHASYITNTQIAFKTENHQLAFYEHDSHVKRRFNTGFMLNIRRKYYEFHRISLSYLHSSIGDTVAILNPEYFLNGNTSQQMFALRYAWINDRRDIMYYPLKGQLIVFEAEKLGLWVFNDINQINFRAEYSKFSYLGRNWYISGTLRQKISFPSEQPYFNVRGLGYFTDVVSGYELYVIDGQHYSLGKLNLKKKIFQIEKQIEAMPGQQFKSIPLALYLKFHTDAGYVTNPIPYWDNHRLGNTLLWGNGIGLDFVTYYDTVLRLEYSINRMMEHGFFVHFKASI
ncbi:MAG: BamA/TamA family outer membrane protein [Cytophagaceae bacterium]